MVKRIVHLVWGHFPRGQITSRNSVIQSQIQCQRASTRSLALLGGCSRSRQHTPNLEGVCGLSSWKNACFSWKHNQWVFWYINHVQTLCQLQALLQSYRLTWPFLRVVYHSVGKTAINSVIKGYQRRRVQSWKQGDELSGHPNGRERTWCHQIKGTESG